MAQLGRTGKKKGWEAGAGLMMEHLRLGPLLCVWEILAQNLGPKRGLDWWLGVQRALLSPTARARPQNPCGNSSSRGRREPGLKKSRGGTQGLTANRVPVGWEMGGCLIKDRGGQASRENHSQSSHLDWHPKNDARAPVQPRRDPHLPKPCWAELISHRKQSEVV